VRKKSWADFLTAVATVLSGAAFVCIARDRFWWGVGFLAISLGTHVGAHYVRVDVGYKLLDEHMKHVTDATVARVEAALRDNGGPGTR
jgi:hypothetical protein